MTPGQLPTWAPGTGGLYCSSLPLCPLGPQLWQLPVSLSYSAAGGFIHQAYAKNRDGRS